MEFCLSAECRHQARLVLDILDEQSHGSLSVTWSCLATVVRPFLPHHAAMPSSVSYNSRGIKKRNRSLSPSPRATTTTAADSAASQQQQQRQRAALLTTLLRDVPKQFVQLCFTTLWETDFLQPLLYRSALAILACSSDRSSSSSSSSSPPPSDRAVEQQWVLWDLFRFLRGDLSSSSSTSSLTDPLAGRIEYASNWHWWTRFEPLLHVRLVCFVVASFLKQTVSCHEVFTVRLLRQKSRELHWMGRVLQGGTALLWNPLSRSLLLPVFLLCVSHRSSNRKSGGEAGGFFQHADGASRSSSQQCLTELPEATWISSFVERLATVITSESPVGNLCAAATGLVFAGTTTLRDAVKAMPSSLQLPINWAQSARAQSVVCMFAQASFAALLRHGVAPLAFRMTARAVLAVTRQWEYIGYQRYEQFNPKSSSTVMTVAALQQQQEASRLPTARGVTSSRGEVERQYSRVPSESRQRSEGGAYDDNAVPSSLMDSWLKLTDAERAAEQARASKAQQNAALRAILGRVAVKLTFHALIYFPIHVLASLCEGRAVAHGIQAFCMDSSSSSSSSLNTDGSASSAASVLATLLEKEAAATWAILTTTNRDLAVLSSLQHETGQENGSGGGGVASWDIDTGVSHIAFGTAAPPTSSSAAPAASRKTPSAVAAVAAGEEGSAEEGAAALMQLAVNIVEWYRVNGVALYAWTSVLDVLWTTLGRLQVVEDARLWVHELLGDK